MSNVTGTLKVNTSSAQTPTNLPGSITPLTINQAISSNYGNGTTADNVDLRYCATLTFVSGTPQALDLTNLTDTSGASLSFARIRRITIIPSMTTDGQTLKLGYSTTTANAWTSLITNPGQLTLQAATANNGAGLVLLAPNTTGWVVGASNKLLNLDPGSAAFSAAIEILGASA